MSPPGDVGRILLVATPGGHLTQLVSLRPAWRGLEPTWVTLPAAESMHMLAGEEVVLAHGPTYRNVPNLLRNLVLAWRTVRARDPDVILSTGAGLAVPFFVVGKLLRKRLVYVESLTRVEHLALSGALVYPLSDTFFVQWAQAARRRRRARYCGSVV
jgi:UDP-N-acetylglucosamine:LPS N-acetylglucosamine transferase